MGLAGDGEEVRLHAVGQAFDAVAPVCRREFQTRARRFDEAGTATRLNRPAPLPTGTPARHPCSGCRARPAVVRGARLPLPPRLGDLVAQGLDQVAQDRAVADLQERLNGHPGHEVQGAEPVEFLRRDRDAGGVVGQAGA